MYINRLSGKFLLVVCLSVILLASCAQAPNASVPTTPTAVPAIPPTPSFLAPLEERLLATLNIPHEPDELVFTEGFIWTKTANGHVIQVDPATNMVVGDIQVDTTSNLSHYCQGLGTDGENIWSCSASGEEENRTINVVRIDPASQSIVATIKVAKIFDQFDMPFLLNQIWVLSGNGDRLVGIDVTTNQPGPAIDLGARCFQLAATDTALLATCALEDLVLQIDPKKKEVTRRVNIESPRTMAATGNAIWVVQDNAVLRLDPESLNPVVAFTLPGVGLTGDVFATDDAVWVRQESGFLYRIDPTTNKVLEQVNLDQSLSGGNVLATSDSIWTTAYDDNLLIRLRLK